MKTLISGIAFALITFINPSQVHAESTKELTCRLLGALIEGGANSGNAQMSEMVEWMQDPLRTQMSNVFNAVQHMTFVSGTAFLVGKLDGYYEEHMVTVELKSLGTGFIRLAYQRYEGQLKLAKFDFDGTFGQSSAKGPFLQKPEKLDCIELTN